MGQTGKCGPFITAKGGALLGGLDCIRSSPLEAANAFNLT